MMRRPPTVLSAANGKLGYAPQVWLGIDRARIRFVGSHLEPPDAFAFARNGALVQRSFHRGWRLHLAVRGRLLLGPLGGSERGSQSADGLARRLRLQAVSVARGGIAQDRLVRVLRRREGLSS